jgi:hypothetical protein
MNKKLIVSTKKLSLTRESLRRMDLSQEQLRDARGGATNSEPGQVSTISSGKTSSSESVSTVSTFTSVRC